MFIKSFRILTNYWLTKKTSNKQCSSEKYKIIGNSFDLNVCFLKEN